VTSEVHARTAEAFATYLTGIEQALTPNRDYLVGENVTIADICYVAELCLFSNERTRAKSLAEKGLQPILHPKLENEFPRAIAHFDKLCKHPAFSPDVEPYLRKFETH
jgi:glutathione S-transferase